MNFYKKKTGYTLIEMLLYLALTTILIGAVSSFVTVVLNFKAKTYAISEVEQVGNQMVLLIGRTIRNGTAINSPAIGGSASTLSLNTLISGNNPTIFSLNGTTLQMKEGSAAVFNITPTTVDVTTLLFTNVARATTNGTIRIQLTISFDNPNNRQESSYTETFYGTADLKI
jgi:Tfp pilus assembly protein PilW